MIDNKFLFFQDREDFDTAYNNGNGIIKPDSIAFVGDGTIHTHGVEYGAGAKSAEEKVENLDTETKEKIDQLRSELEALAEELQKYAKEKHDSIIADANKAFEDARARIIEVREIISKYGAGYSDADVVYEDGTVKAWSEAVNEAGNTYNRLEVLLNAAQGYMRLYGESVNIDTQVVQQYVNEINSELGTLNQQLRYINLAKDIYRVVGRTITNGNDDLSASIRDYIEEYFTNEAGDKITSLVELQLSIDESGNPAWRVLVSKVNDLESWVSSITVDPDKIVNMVNEVEGARQLLGAFETKVNNLLGSVTTGLLAEWSDSSLGKEVAATILAYANESGSDITLDADHIKLSGNTTIYGNTDVQGVLTSIQGKFDKIDANDITAKELVATNAARQSKMTINADGLTFTVGTKTQVNIKSDGDGQLAGGNIYWDAAGNLHAKNLKMDSDSGFTNDASSGKYIDWIEVSGIHYYPKGSVQLAGDYSYTDSDHATTSMRVVLHKDGLVVNVRNINGTPYPNDGEDKTDGNGNALLYGFVASRIKAEFPNLYDENDFVYITMPDVMFTYGALYSALGLDTTEPTVDGLRIPVTLLNERQHHTSYRYRWGDISFDESRKPITKEKINGWYDYTTVTNS